MNKPLILPFLTLLVSCAEPPHDVLPTTDEALVYAEEPSSDSTHTDGPIGVIGAMTGPALQVPHPEPDSTKVTYVTLPTGSYDKIVRLIEWHGTQWPEPDIRSYFYFDRDSDRYDLSMVRPHKPAKPATVLMVVTLKDTPEKKARVSYSCLLYPSDSVKVGLPMALLPSGKPWKDKAREVIIALQYK